MSLVEARDGLQNEIKPERVKTDQVGDNTWSVVDHRKRKDKNMSSRSRKKTSEYDHF